MEDRLFDLGKQSHSIHVLHSSLKCLVLHGSVPSHCAKTVQM